MRLVLSGWSALGGRRVPLGRVELVREGGLPEQPKEEKDSQADCPVDGESNAESFG